MEDAHVEIAAARLRFDRCEPRKERALRALRENLPTVFNHDAAMELLIRGTSTGAIGKLGAEQRLLTVAAALFILGEQER